MMEPMPRITVDLGEHYEPVRKLSEETGIPMSRLVRHLVGVARSQVDLPVQVDAVITSNNACKQCGRAHTGQGEVMMVVRVGTSSQETVCNSCFTDRVRLGVWVVVADRTGPAW